MALLSSKSARKLRKALRNLTPLIYTILLSLGAAAVHSRLYASNFGEQLELYQSDLWFRVRGTIAPPKEIVIVGIDEATYQELGFSHVKPISRAALGQMVQALSEAGAELAILDIFFQDEGESPEENKILADALGSMPTFIGSFRYAATRQLSSYDEMKEVSPRPQFEARAKEVAMMNLFEEPKVRHFSLFRLNGRHEPLPVVFGRYRGLEIPKPSDLINYYGPPGSIPEVSAYKVLKDPLDTNIARFRGKIVFMGSAVPASAAFTVKDAFFVPGSSQSAVGVEVHSTVVSNILRHEWIKRFPPEFELPILNGVVVLIAFLLGRLNPRVGMVSAGFFVVAWLVGAYLAFTHHLFIPGVNLCLIVIPLMLLCTMLTKLKVLRERYARMQKMLGAKLDV
jgi:CHASE2 domain-containing sensor protein